jgi:FKBP-type peptidyl-prolyl cis-trans isomerase FkpA
MNKKKDEETSAREAYIKKNNITATPTPSGLIYIELKKGNGPKCEAGKMVNVQYTGTLLDGTKFDSSYDHGGQPFEFVVGQGQVIPGWDEGLMMMNEGGKAKFIIPSGIGYGGQAAGPIPPYSTLVFEVELVKVKDAPAPTAGGMPQMPTEQKK